MSVFWNREHGSTFHFYGKTAPACVACFEEIVAMGAKKFVLFGSCGVLDDNKVKDNIIGLNRVGSEISVLWNIVYNFYTSFLFIFGIYFNGYSPNTGVLDDNKVKDNIIIPVSAVRDEGTSYHYITPSPEIEANTHSIQILENVLTACGYPYVKGKTWTSDQNKQRRQAHLP